MNVEKISNYFIQAFPAKKKNEQRLSLAVYRTLALGQPVTIEQLHSTTNLPSKEINHILHSWPGVFFDDNNKVIGFWGISVQEMPHRLKMNDHLSYAWCAWDTLFIPELLNKTVKIESDCPVTGNHIELNVSLIHAESVFDKPIFL